MGMGKDILVTGAPDAPAVLSFHTLSSLSNGGRRRSPAVTRHLMTAGFF